MRPVLRFGKSITMALASGAASVAVLAVAAWAGAENVAFPANYDKGVLYATVDRADNKQTRDLSPAPAPIAAVKSGKPTPSGTVVTLVQYAAKLDAAGNPEKDAKGRFIKANIIGYTVMEKRTGWGAEYPAAQRNGEWEYRAFKADKTPNPAANLTACFNCHKPLGDAKDYLFSFDRMKAAP